MPLGEPFYFFFFLLYIFATGIPNPSPHDQTHLRKSPTHSHLSFLSPAIFLFIVSPSSVFITPIINALIASVCSGFCHGYTHTHTHTSTLLSSTNLFEPSGIAKHFIYHIDFKGFFFFENIFYHIPTILYLYRLIPPPHPTPPVYNLRPISNACVLHHFLQQFYNTHTTLSVSVSLSVSVCLCRIITFTFIWVFFFFCVTCMMFCCFFLKIFFFFPFILLCCHFLNKLIAKKIK